MEGDAGRIGDAVAMASRLETDGRAFYLEASRKVSGRMGQLMYESLARDEENHLKMLDRLVREILDEPLDRVLAGTPASRVQSLFAEHRAELDERVAASPGDVAALETALRMEEESVRLYERLATQSQGAVADLFRRLVGEEQQHHRMLENTRSFLEDTGNWFIYDEHGNMDGG